MIVHVLVLESRKTYVIENVVSINRILGDVIIQYIDGNNRPQTATYLGDESVKIQAIVL